MRPIASSIYLAVMMLRLHGALRWNLLWGHWLDVFR
jgi:hypothetical protein